MGNLLIKLLSLN